MPHRPPPIPNRPPGRSAFTRRFLDHLSSEEDPPTGLAAEREGPWSCFPTGRRFRVARSWEDLPEPEPTGPTASHDASPPAPRSSDPGTPTPGAPPLDAPPLGVTATRHAALLLVAAATARDRAESLRLGERAAGDGWPVRAPGDTAPLAWLGAFDQELVQALALCDGLVRSPNALASLLEAAGPTALELTGRCLVRRAALGSASGEAKRPATGATAPGSEPSADRHDGASSA